MTNTPIPQHVLDAAGRSAHFTLLGLVNHAFARSGMTPEDLVTRLGWSRNRVLRTLKGRNRLSLRAAAALCWAIDGSAIHFGLVSSEPSE